MSEQFYVTDGSDLERLLSMGFSGTQAERLIRMKDNVNEQPEYRELLAESRRLSFMRWLIDHDRIRR